MRIATLGISHEANTFSSVPASLDHWERSGILHGEQIIEQYATAQATISGFLALGQEDPNVHVEPLLFSRITPMGPITATAFEHLSDQMLNLLTQGGPWDGVLLALHGAAVSDEYPDADGEILRRVRQVLGPNVTVGLTLDMHANISPLMVRDADVVTVYQTNPHVDAREQALRAGRMVRDAIAGRLHPRMALQMVPVAINILRQGTDDFPVRALLDAARAAERRPGVLSVSVVEGYPYADVPEMGMSVVVIADDDDALAGEVAAELAELAWQVREHAQGTAVSIEDALRQAARAERGPVVLLDTGDNVGAGSPGDSTYLLAAAQRMAIPGVFCSLYDPEAVRAAVQAGPRGVGSPGCRWQDGHDARGAGAHRGTGARDFGWAVGGFRSHTRRVQVLRHRRQRASAHRRRSRRAADLPPRGQREFSATPRCGAGPSDATDHHRQGR